MKISEVKLGQILTDKVHGELSLKVISIKGDKVITITLKYQKSRISPHRGQDQGPRYSIQDSLLDEFPKAVFWILRGDLGCGFNSSLENYKPVKPRKPVTLKDLVKK